MRRSLIVIFALAIVAAAAVPLVAFVILPQLSRSTLTEALPTEPDASTRPGAAAASVVPATAAPVILLRGELVRINAVDYGTGTVRIVRVGEARILRFDGVDIAGAPDIYVYLSERSDGRPGTFIDLGRLKATNGSFNYTIPAGADLGAVRSVVLWCRQFNVTITYAELR